MVVESSEGLVIEPEKFVKSKETLTSTRYFKKLKEGECEDLSDHVQTPLEECPYEFKDGLRLVKPYPYTFRSHAKERWCGRRILDHFMTEFVGAQEAQVKSCIADGRIKVNGEIVEESYIIKMGDTLTHDVLRWELPVSDKKIEVISMDEDVIAVNKPASIPVHPTGKYFKNSLLQILQYELGMTGLACLNRIDLPVSGLVVVTRRKGAVRDRLHNELREKCLQKVYLAKVYGKVEWDEMVCEAPLTVSSHNSPLTYVDFENGKLCETHFRKLSCTKEYSLLECRPVSGRRHQIRVHLVHLGHTIVNDEQYMSKELKEEHPIEEWNGAGMRGICLHAFRYSGSDWSYESTFPDWFDCPEAHMKLSSNSL